MTTDNKKAVENKKTVDMRKKIENKKKRCFVITPIGDEMSTIRRHIEGVIDASITPALGEKYDIIVSHRIFEQGMITKQIINEIYNDDLVIANLTERNPNVMYELALCHSLGKPVIMIAEKDTALPADIIMQRTIFYRNDAQGVLELKSELSKAESEISYGKLCGPLVDILGDISHDVSFLQQAKQKENYDEVGTLEYLIKRLDRIEESIVKPRRDGYSRTIAGDSKKFVTLLIAFESINSSLTSYSIRSRLNRTVALSYLGVSIHDVELDNENKLINIDLYVRNNIDLFEVSNEICNVLSVLGVEELRTKVSVSPPNDDALII